MTSKQLFSIIISYSFIIIGFGLIIEWMIRTTACALDAGQSLRYFHWTFGAITLIHLIILVIYTNAETEARKGNIALFSLTNYFFLCFLSFAIYYWLFFAEGKIEAITSMVFFIVHFIFSIGMTLKVSQS